MRKAWMKKAWTKKAVAVTMAVAMAATVLTGCGGADNDADAEKAVVINFPTAATTGALYPLGAAITNLWTEELDYVTASSQASGGGVENLNLLASGEAQVSIAISSNCYESYTGTGTFDGRKNENLRAIAGLYYNPNQVVVLDGKGYETLSDLEGAHFATGAAGSSTEGESKNHFTATGLTYPDDINAEYVGFTEAIDLMRNKQLDGAWVMAALGNSAVTEATSTAGAKVLNIDDAVIEALQAEYPWYAKFVIPAGTYNNTEDVQTTAIKMVMFTTADLDEDTVYDLTKTFWEHVEELAETNSALKGVTVEGAVTDLAGLPIHDGAAKYYREIGVLE